MINPEEQRFAATMFDIKKRIDASKAMIWVTFRKPGIHCYPAASTDPSLADVSFLGYPHRHLFHFKVGIQVFHADREIEFLQFSNWLQKQYESATLTLDHLSCEMIADELFVAIAGRYPNREIEISISEDGENGCTKTYLINQN
jgi:hypothetical protein